MKAFSSWFSVGLLALLLLAMRLPAAAQAPAWQSAQVVAAATAAATNNFSTVNATTVDATGNIFLTGSFTNTVILGGTTLTSLGSYDIFVAKFNPTSNQFVWAQRAGGIEDDYANAVAVSGTSVYVTGSFSGATAGFGTTTLINASAGTTDIFVVKLTDSGSTSSFTWAQRAGGIDADYGYGLAVNGSSVYVAGHFASLTADFGPTTLANASVGAFITTDLFVAKLIDAGNTSSFVWAQRAGGTGHDYAIKLAVSGTSVYVAGEFRSITASFGSTILTNTSSNNTADVFVAKITDAGSTSSFVWAQRAGGTNVDRATALAVSGSSVYVAGYFQSPTASFGLITLTNIASNSTADVFVAKLTEVGSTVSFVWVQQAGGMNNDGASALAVSGTSLYVTGAFYSLTASFGTTTLPSPDSSTLGYLASLTDATLTATTTSRPLAPAQLFPNPARGAATLRLPAGTAPAPLVLTDALGRAVRRYPAPASPEVVLDLGGLPAGLYLLRGAGPAQRLAVE